MATAAVLVPQQALDSLVPKPPDKKNNKDQEPSKELGNQDSMIVMYLSDSFIVLGPCQC